MKKLHSIAVTFTLLSFLSLILPNTSFGQSGVTVITHGFQPTGGGADLSFLDAYAKAIQQKAGNKASIFINDVATGTWVSSGVNNTNSKNDEIILLYNWSVYSNNATKGYLESAADQLFALLQKPPLGMTREELFNKPKHFIAHSRGNVLFLQLFHRFKKYFPTVNVEQYTSFDPHPAEGVGLLMRDFDLNGVYSDNNPYNPFTLGRTKYKLVLPSNILKADNYYHIDGNYEGLDPDFDGVFVEGATNSLLGDNLFITDNCWTLRHSKIHNWYYYTILTNNNTVPSGYCAPQNSWYPNNIRTTLGYNKGRIAGGSLSNVSSTNDTRKYEPESVFNGGFDYATAGWDQTLGNLTNLDVALWRDFGYTNKAVLPLYPRRELTHSFMYFPAKKYFRFKIDRIITNGTLKITFSDKTSTLREISLPLTTGSQTNKVYYCEVPTQLLNQVGTFTLRYEGTALQNGLVVDDFTLDDTQGDIMISPDVRLNSSITVTPSPIKQGQAANVTVDLKNFGATGFSGDLACSLHNVGDSNPLVDIEVKTSVSLAANGTVRLTFSKANITNNAGSYDLYIKQKPTGQNWSVLSANGYTNPLRVTIQANSCTDLYESNNSFSAASFLNYSGSGVFVSSEACIGSVGDKDYYRFVVNGKTYYAMVQHYNNTVAGGSYSLSISVAGNSMTLKTQPLTGRQTIDTYLYLYNESQAQVAGDDDSGGNYYSALTYTPMLDLGQSSTPPSASASGTSVSVTSNVSWTASSNAAWCTVSPSNGSNNGTLSVNWSINTGTTQRPATITVSGGGMTRYFYVTQAGATLSRPSNDEPCNAISITPSSSGSYITGTTINATTTTSAANPTCATATNDVWYKFVVPTSGSFTIVTKAGSMTDAVIGIYAGNNCSALNGGNNTLCKDDNTDGTRMPFLAFSGYGAYAGNTLYIRIWGYGSTTGTFTIGVLNYYSTTTYNLVANNGNYGQVQAAQKSTQVTDESNNLDGLLGSTKILKVLKTKQLERGQINVYPNPTKSILNLDYAVSSDGQVEMTLLNVTGQIVKQLKGMANSGENTLNIDVEDLQSGFYLLKLQTIDGLKTQKVQIQR